MRNKLRRVTSMAMLLVQSLPRTPTRLSKQIGERSYSFRKHPTNLSGFFCRGTVQRASGSDLVDRTYYWAPFVSTLYVAIVSGTGKETRSRRKIRSSSSSKRRVDPRKQNPNTLSSSARSWSDPRSDFELGNNGDDEVELDRCSQRGREQIRAHPTRRGKLAREEQHHHVRN